MDRIIYFRILYIFGYKINNYFLVTHLSKIMFENYYRRYFMKDNRN